MHAALIIIPVVGLLFVADRAFALLGFPVEVPIKISNPARFEEVRKNIEFTEHFKTNRMGLRYDDIPFQKPAGERRVFVVGDSFTEGLGVEADQTWLSDLERDFAAGGRFIRFINGGLQNTGPMHYARVLHRIGFRYHPDAVVVLLYANDLTDTDPVSDPGRLAKNLSWLDQRFVPEKTAHRSIMKRFLGFIPRLRTMLHEFKDYLRNRRPHDIVKATEREARRRGISEARIREWRRSLSPLLVDAADRGLMNANVITSGLLHPDSWIENLDIKGPDAEKRWLTMTASIEAIIKDCRRQNVPVYFVYAPNGIQYDAAFGGPMKATGTLVRHEWLTGTEAESRLGEWMRRNDVPFLNLAPAFRAAAKTRPGRLQYSIDGHWTPEGHALAAAEIGRWLERQKSFSS